MSGSPKLAPDVTQKVSQAPVARLLPVRGSGVTLEPVPMGARAKVHLRKLRASASRAVRSVASAFVAVIDKGLFKARSVSDRLLWRLGYAEIKVVEGAEDGTGKGGRRATRSGTLPGNRATTDGPTLESAPLEDQPTAIFSVDELEDAKTTVSLHRMTTEDEVTRVLPDNVVSFSRALANRKN